MMRPLLIALTALLLSFPVHAEEAPKPDDRVMYDISAEQWVTTKTARVMVNVEAAVSGNNASTMRADMQKAVNELAKSDWRLTSFNRGQDQTGLERWSALFEARLPENELGGIGDDAKKLSKAGMQLTVSSIDFSPTLDEMEAARASLRTEIYKKANEQLTALNAALPGRNYRIAMIGFGGMGGMPMMAMGRDKMFMRAEMATMSAPAAPAMDQSMERSEKITLTANVVFAALPAK